MLLKLKKLVHAGLRSGLLGANFRYLPAMAGHFLHSMRDKGREVINGLEISIEFRCNQKCSFCATSIFQSQLKEKRDQVLSTGEIKDLIVQTKEMHGYFVVFIGGEPLLRDDLDELIAFAHDRRVIPYLFTNATLITAKRAGELKKAGLLGASVSIHGIGGAHDQVTGIPGSFERTVAGIGHLKANGLYVKAGLVPTRENIRSGELARILNWCEQMRLDAKFNFVMPVGMLGNDTAGEVLLTPDDLAQAKALFERHVGVSNDILYGRGFKRCPAGNYAVEISEFGDVFPCFFIHISYGNIRQSPLRDIVAKMRSSPYFNVLRHDHCIAALNPEFIGKYMKPIWDAKDYPLRLEDHPRHDRDNLGDLSL